jgi:trigger factor
MQLLKASVFLLVWMIDLENSKLRNGAVLEVKVTPQDKWRRLIDVQMTAAELEPHFDKALRNYQKQISIQGFRKGKVPLPLVQKLYGNSIKAEKLEEMLPDILGEVREREGLKPAAPMKIEDFKFEPENGLQIRASLDVEPEVEIKKYKGFELEKQVLEINDDVVARQLENIRERNAGFKDHDGPAQYGHFVQADLQAIDVAGLPIIGKKYDDRVFLLEKDETIVGPSDDLNGQLVGLKTGETKSIRIVEPPDPAAGDAPSSTYFQVKVKAIKEKILPALDDEFAKNLGKYESLDQLRDDVRRSVEIETSAYATQALKNQLMDSLVKDNAIDLPDSMIEHNLDLLIEGMKSREKKEFDVDAARQEYRAGTIWSIKWRLLKEKLIAQEKIVAEDKEVEQYVMAVARARRQNPQREWNRIKGDHHEFDRARDEVLEEKLLGHLLKQQTIHEKKISQPDSQKSRLIV